MFCFLQLRLPNFDKLIITELVQIANCVIALITVISNTHMAIYINSAVTNY